MNFTTNIEIDTLPKKNILVLGSCRQDSLNELYNVSKIKENISYPHYTKEIIQLLDYCLYNNISEEDTQYTFRTPILYRTKLKWDIQFQNDIKTCDVAIIEIASFKCYKYQDRFVHHILYDHSHFNKNKNDIELYDSTDKDIENDIIYIKNTLNKPIIIVGHLVTKNSGKRYELLKLLENICNKHNISFLNPVKELSKTYNNLDTLFVKHEILSHYTTLGHNAILKIYKHFIENI